MSEMYKYKELRVFYSFLFQDINHEFGTQNLRDVAGRHG